jgi:hypothetical protein
MALEPAISPVPVMGRANTNLTRRNRKRRDHHPDSTHREPPSDHSFQM